MSTRLYLFILGGVSTLVVLGVGLVAGFRIASLKQPKRPARVPETAVWRPTPSEKLLLKPHGDWVSCRNQGASEHCVLIDVSGELEYEGTFLPLPEDSPLPNPRLLPVTSDTVSPWMWSNHANRLVPVIQMEDGTVLAPAASRADLRAYVDRVQKFSARLARLPVPLEYHPAGTPQPGRDR